MATVFVSHSKHDVHLRKFFSEIFANIGLKAKFMEWEDFSGKYAGKEISWRIRAGFFSGHDTSAVIVLLGENLGRPPTNSPEFTHNWVTFEVGAAAGCLKPVWVFEEYSKFIKFPIPYVSNYAQYEIDSKEDLRYYSKIFEEQILYPSSTKTIVPISVTCPYENCNAKYQLWKKGNSINCPVCRRGITLT